MKWYAVFVSTVASQSWQRKAIPTRHVRLVGEAKMCQKHNELAKEIIEVGQRLQEVESLCGEIIATLNLEGNQYYFEEMPEMWHDLVTLWTERWQATRNKKST
jgi:hypothetical protein